MVLYPEKYDCNTFILMSYSLTLGLRLKVFSRLRLLCVTPRFTLISVLRCNTWISTDFSVVLNVGIFSSKSVSPSGITQILV